MIGYVNRVIDHSLVDGPGNRTAIFFQGCQFNCRYCHNPETLHRCVGCGQCRVVCPTGAISINTNINPVFEVLADRNTKVIAQIAPAVRVAVGEAFGLPKGENVMGKLVSVLHRLGFAEVYDLFMDQVPYEKWSGRIIQILSAYGIRDGLVLDLGCGTGSMTELLAGAGYDMIGVDASEEMLELAYEKRAESGHDILYLLQDMQEFELYGTVRAVISVCDSLNYLTEKEDLLQVFRLVNNYLYPGGVFIFDFNTTYKYREVIGNTTIAENREDCSFIWENYYDPEEEINEYDLTIFVQEEEDIFRRFTETHLQRGYTAEQMRALLEQAGLNVLEIMDSDTGEAATATSERVYIVAKEQQKELPTERYVK